MIITAALFVTPFCNPAPDMEKPLFDNVDTIPVTTANSTRIDFSLSGIDFKYVVVAVFDTDPTVDENNILTINPKGGIRSGMTGFTTTTVLFTDIHPYNTTTKDFDNSGAVAYSATDYRIVWAYDSGYILIASSVERPF